MEPTVSYKMLNLNFNLEPEEWEEFNEAEFYTRSARTNVMMYKATGQRHYLSAAKLDVLKAKSIRDCGFVRPLGVLLCEAA